MPIVAYLDLLGFRQAARRRDGSATALLEGYNAILHSMVADHHWAEEQTTAGHGSHSDASLQWARRLAGLNTFLPMSDSLFVVHDDAGTMFGSLASFLEESALVHSTLIDHPDYNPLKTPPILFRGGIAEGDTDIGRQLAVNEGAIIPHANVFGVAVVDAVETEEAIKAKRKKGPLVWISSTTRTSGLPANLIGPSGVDGYEELLWPNAALLESTGELDVLKLHALENMAITCERRLADPAIAAHYTGLRHLLRRSLSKAGKLEEAMQWLREPLLDL